MPTFSRSLEQSLHRALALANERHHEYATLEHLLLALIDDQDASAVMREAGRVAGIVKSMAAFAHAPGGFDQPTPVPEIVADLMLASDSALRSDRISVRTIIEPGLPAVMCRRADIQQVLTHVLANAREALVERRPAADAMREPEAWWRQPARPLPGVLPLPAYAVAFMDLT